ncbi:hypothetical protein HOG48_01025, partial [Candidatus Peregrinibacteria bacterium]|nr:hypothetical protein [Candidatus Peregrinibacteria bacterium]
MNRFGSQNDMEEYEGLDCADEIDASIDPDSGHYDSMDEAEMAIAQTEMPLLKKDALIAAASQFPYDTMHNYYKFKEEPYAEEVLDAMQNACYESNDPRILNILQWIAEKRNNGSIFLDGIENFLEHEDAKNILYELFIKNAYGLDRAIPKFKEQTYAGTLLKSLALGRPNEIFLAYDDYADQSYAEDILIIFAETSGWVILQYEKFDDQPRALETAARSVMKENPTFSLEILRRRIQRGAPPIILPFDNVKKLADENPLFIIGYDDVIATAPYYDEIIWEAVKIIWSLLPSGFPKGDFEDIKNDIYKRIKIAFELLRNDYKFKENGMEAAAIMLTLVDNLLKDPALAEVHLILPEWLSLSSEDESLKPTESANLATIIARNLYFQGQSVSKETVQAEQERLAAIREEHRDIPVFEGRNILIGSHPEKWESGINRFANDEMLTGISHQQGNTDLEFEHYRADKEIPRDAEKVKTQILDKIATMGSPMTFLFDGHGTPEAILLSGMNEKRELSPDAVPITYQELAEAFKKRSDSLNGRATVSDDILIFTTCYNHSFIRNLYEELDLLSCDKPITIGPSEYGQVTYSTPMDQYGSLSFGPEMLSVGGEHTTLGDLWAHPSSTDP